MNHEPTLFQSLLDTIKAQHDGLLPLTCLVCRSELVSWEAWALCPDCRYYYPHEMIANADPAEWRAIQVGKLACTICEPALPNTPRVHIDDAGLPMPCPVMYAKVTRVHPVVAWWNRQRRRARETVNVWKAR
jgi:hypothetical protein